MILTQTKTYSILILSPIFHNIGFYRVHGGLEPLVELIKDNKDNTNKDDKVGEYLFKLATICGVYKEYLIPQY